MFEFQARSPSRRMLEPSVHNSFIPSKIASPKQALHYCRIHATVEASLTKRERESIGPSHVTTEISDTLSGSCNKTKAIPLESILEHLTSLTGISTSDIATHFLELFAADASLKFRLPLHDLNFFESLKPDEGILLSGCQANETSADMMNLVMTGGKACGAFSNAIEMVLRKHEAPLSNRKVVMLARVFLKEQGIEQHPCLYCSGENANATFLYQPAAHQNSSS
ncbi:hypothetical protein ACLB2K_029551 [Fragaria x ananassa]